MTPGRGAGRPVPQPAGRLTCSRPREHEASRPLIGNCYRNKTSKRVVVRATVLHVK